MKENFDCDMCGQTKNTHDSHPIKVEGGTHVVCLECHEDEYVLGSDE